jgi:hypothetical protein
MASGGAATTSTIRRLERRSRRFQPCGTHFACSAASPATAVFISVTTPPYRECYEGRRVFREVAPGERSELGFKDFLER